MDNYILNIFSKYFKSLSKIGYKSYDIVFKILIIDFIHDLCNYEMRSLISENDKVIIQNLLNKLSSSTCEIEYFDIFNKNECVDNSIPEIPEIPDIPEILEKTVTIEFDSLSIIGITIDNVKYLQSDTGKKFNLIIKK